MNAKKAKALRKSLGYIPRAAPNFDHLVLVKGDPLPGTGKCHQAAINNPKSKRFIYREMKRELKGE